MHPPIVCPVCKTSFGSEVPHGTFSCASCGETYRSQHGIPVLIAASFLDSFKQTEQHFHDELSESASKGTVRGRNSAFHEHFERPMMALPEGSAVAEIACGTRADGIEIAMSGKYVTSIDLSPDAVFHARELSERADAASRMRFIAADAEHLPFADKSFNATFVAASFHHFPHQIQALKEMKRVTKPGGYVIWGVEPASWPYRTVFKALAPAKRFIRARQHRKFNSIADDTTDGYTEKGIRAMFKEAGLAVTDIRRVKLLSELYDSTVRLTGRLIRRPLFPLRSVDHVLARIDASLDTVPLLKSLYWHFNVISRVPDGRTP